MSYAGDVTPQQAHEILNDQPDAVLIDVRTTEEWRTVGVPAINGARFVEWNQWPTGQPNPDFVRQATEGLDPNQTILLLCRSGARSIAAAIALTEAGFENAYNVLEGFEGRSAPGWRDAGLPWQQG